MNDSADVYRRPMARDTAFSIFATYFRHCQSSVHCHPNNQETVAFPLISSVYCGEQVIPGCREGDKQEACWTDEREFPVGSREASVLRVPRVSGTWGSGDVLDKGCSISPLQSTNNDNFQRGSTANCTFHNVYLIGSDS